jgi:hypothetical protein
MVLEPRKKVLKPKLICFGQKQRTKRLGSDMYSHEEPDQLHSSLAIDVAEPCCECPMKYGNDLLAPSVEGIPLLPRVLREVHDVRHFQWFDAEFAPLSVEENALVLLGGQFQ